MDIWMEKFSPQKILFENVQIFYHLYQDTSIISNFAGFLHFIIILSLITVPTGPPQGIRAVFVSSTSITISWQAPLLELQNGDITSYYINVLELETNIVRNFTAVPTDSIYVVNSLHPFYSYNCSVAAYTNGLGPSDHFTVQTLQEGNIYLKLVILHA